MGEVRCSTLGFEEIRGNKQRSAGWGRKGEKEIQIEVEIERKRGGRGKGERGREGRGRERKRTERGGEQSKRRSLLMAFKQIL